MTSDIFVASSDEELLSCFPSFSALRPHFQEQEFLSQVRWQQAQSYQIVALKHGGTVQSAAGFRFAEFLAWGKVLYIDDLTPCPRELRGLMMACVPEASRLLECVSNHLEAPWLSTDKSIRER